MKYLKTNTKSRTFNRGNTKPIVAIVCQKSKKNKPFFQGTIDYKNVLLLRKFISSEGKILPRRLSGLNAKQQRYITKSIKNARIVGLLPFINYTSPL